VHPDPESKHYCGSLTLKHEFESADPYHWLKNPDPAPDPVLFVSGFQDVDRKYHLVFLLNVFCVILLKVHLHQSSNIINQSQNNRNQGFSYFFFA